MEMKVKIANTRQARDKNYFISSKYCALKPVDR